MTKTEAEQQFGTINEDGYIAGRTGKYAGIPWLLAAMFANGDEDESIGEVDGIGYHALFSFLPGERPNLPADIRAIYGAIVRETDHGGVDYQTYGDEKSYRKACDAIRDDEDAYYAHEEPF